MGLFDKVTGLLGGLLGKLGPAGALIPMLLDVLKTKMNNEDVEGVVEVGVQFQEVGAKFTKLGDGLVAMVDPNSPGGTAITGSEYAARSAELLQLADELADMAESIKNL